MREERNVNEVMEDENELSEDALEQVSGGAGAFANVPRVPTHQIDQNLKDKI